MLTLLLTLIKATSALLSLVHHKAALVAALAATGNSEPKVRLAAIDALGRVGDASTVTKLLALAGSQQKAEQAAARQSLLTIPGKGVNDALLKVAEDTTGSRIRVVITMRRDYYNLCSEYSDFYERIERRTERRDGPAQPAM